MNPIKTYFILLTKNHYARILTACVLAGIGSLLGTDGLMEIESARKVFDVIMWIGFGVIGIYTLVGTGVGIYKGLGFGYQPGDYNKWRDGDFEEWKKKNPNKKF